jgi:type I restriction enzyme M protein
MLDAETKRKIDNCRDVLVGKIPDPKSQVEQITIALIYKFMDDMDQLSVEQGGKASFFRGEFEKYSWSSIFDPHISGFELFNLYGEALTKMNHNPNIPQLFRDIFKNAYLPYRDPETLRMFLKEIRGFSYDHSEKLGDAFEYLLSVLSSQGDAGQFRTPRHIIDFMVKVVDPQLNETVLDPACGTAGFLISAYKNITANNQKLNPDQKKRLLNNFVGYDISPDMVRLSLVNMYLHGFKEPHIVEYDTLTSEERWQDTFDVIMANPPFMSPKGGIRPHSRFSIPAKRSEVLFVDYIAEHLNPSGRAGVIVPEGIIFQSQNAYKALRKMLVENCLWAVVSLPAGVFNPYSGVKTCILLMDKSLAKRIDKILFVKIENDGYDLGAQRRQIDKDDLPAAQKYLNIYKSKITNYKSEIKDSSFAIAVPKSEIAKSGDYNLSGDRYIHIDHRQTAKYPIVPLGTIVEVISGQSPDGKYYNDKGEGTPFYQGKTEFGEMYVGEPQTWTTQITKIALKDDILMSVRAPVGPVNFATQKICIGRGLASIRSSKKINNLYLFYYLRSIQDKIKGNGGAVFDSISRTQMEDIKIPLPPLDVQEKIVAEIDGYQKIIDGARQIVENYKPTIKINPAWPIVELGTICELEYGYTDTAKESGDTRFIRITDIDGNGCLKTTDMKFINLTKESSLFLLKEGDLLVARTGATFGKTLLFMECYQSVFASYLIRLNFAKDKICSNYYWTFAQSENYWNQAKILMTGGGQQQFNANAIKKIKIPLPPLVEQKQIVSQIETEQKIVNENKKLIEIFEKKISDTISSLWGE